jgi:hypothetical protein
MPRAGENQIWPLLRAPRSRARRPAAAAMAAGWPAPHPASVDTATARAPPRTAARRLATTAACASRRQPCCCAFVGGAATALPALPAGTGSTAALAGASGRRRRGGDGMASIFLLCGRSAQHKFGPDEVVRRETESGAREGLPADRRRQTRFRVERQRRILLSRRPAHTHPPHTPPAPRAGSVCSSTAHAARLFTRSLSGTLSLPLLRQTPAAAAADDRTPAR